MFYYIEQPCNPSFAIELVTTKSDFIVRSVENGLERWMLLVAVICVDAFLFWDLSDLTCHHYDTGISLFWLHCAAW